MDDYRLGLNHCLPTISHYSRGSLNSSEVKMSPRPAKTPAWSAPLDNDPSSCSDNASDNSEKMESKKKNENLSCTNSTTARNRKRKMGNSLVSEREGGSSTQVGLWAEAESLAADFDGSLSGLGGDLSTASYDMSEALLALPSLYQQRINVTNNPVGYLSMKEAGLTPLAAAHLHGGSSVSLPGDFHFEPHSSTPSLPQEGATGASLHSANGVESERRFQYVLAAATSIATKLNEETLTYLNQGQSYEIKLKKLGELTAYRGVVFRSVIRLCFHDRRLQFSEREQIAQWEDSHLNDRILQADLPLSYGLTILPNCNGVSTNTVSLLWEPLKEVGLYVKVNCISTEFTPKKHGGEKGVPFRMLIETFSHPDNVRLHAAACQIKVFKLKGADRKHKQDREKILKKTPGEQAKFQPSYDCTVLSDVSLESLESGRGIGSGQERQTVSPTYISDHGGADSPETFPSNSTSPSCGNSSYFSPHFSPESVRRWLLRSRFGSTKTLWDYSGLDLLRLQKEELIELCGLAEGIRLHNALHYKITFYVTLRNIQENGEDPIFHPVCLSSASIPELISVLGSLFQSLSPGDFLPIERLFLSVYGGSRPIRVLLNQQLLSTIKDQTPFRAIKHGTDVSLEILE